MPTNSQLRKLCPHVPEIDDLFELPEEAVSRRTTKMGLVTPSGKKLVYPFKGKILNRPIHDESLVDSAKKAGATDDEIKAAIQIAAEIQRFSTLLYGNEFDVDTFNKIIGRDNKE